MKKEEAKHPSPNIKTPQKRFEKTIQFNYANK